jgi:hypothetical protein
MDHVIAEGCWEADEVEGVERGRGDAPSIDEVVEKADESLISAALQVPRGSIQSPPRNSSHDSSHLIAGQRFGRFNSQIN